MLASLFSDKSIKPSAKTEMVAKLLLDKKITPDELIKFTITAKDPAKATCIEAFEYASKTHPEFVNKKAFRFMVTCLSEKAPRLKWESARVVGNTVHLHKAELEEAITALLDNSEHEGTVVRWTAAFALGEIIKLKTKWNVDLIPAAEAIVKREEKNSIRKIYENALKKISK